MTYTADYLIAKRREKWEELHSTAFDREFRASVVQEMAENKGLREEVQRFPEKLIELVFVVIDKDKKELPFFLNEVQKDFMDTLNKAIADFEAGRTAGISILVLKGRQQGFTTLITAYQLARCITRRNFEGYTLADVSSNAEAIFQQKAKYPYSQLPERLKPTEKFNNRKQMLFSVLNSMWSVDTATKDVGRSRTVNFFHGSECAFWNDGISPIQAALGQAFTKNCIQIYESTANGYNDFKEMWDSGAHINCFYEWWRTKEYRVSFPDGDSRSEFLSWVENRKGEIWSRLKWLRDDKKLEAEQLYWYYNKWLGYIDKRLMKQEYPCDPQEAFLLSGATVFDTEALLHRKSQLPRPLKVGYFTFDYDGLKISNVKWVNDRNGYIRLYKLPNTPAFTKYALGGDTAGDGSDYFTGHVVDARTQEQVAVLKHKFDADQYARQMYCLGMYYGWALIGIEANFDTYPIRELERLGYPNQYVREAQDEYTGRTEKRLGFKTTQVTRPMVISRLIGLVRDHTNLLNDRDTVEELMTIIRNEHGRVEAPAGGHDDQMMGLAITYEIESQVVWETESIQVPPTQAFNIEKEMEAHYDYGESIVVV